MENRLSPEEQDEQDAMWENVQRINAKEPTRLDRVCLLFSMLGADTFSEIFSFLTPDLIKATVITCALETVQDRVATAPPLAEILLDFSTDDEQQLVTNLKENPELAADYVARMLHESTGPHFA
ncbi:MAG: hypothetical protein JNM27_19960 [Leptospirales bacterium]|nr:hypothetical protein [Leptospirales bacterium]